MQEMTCDESSVISVRSIDSGERSVVESDERRAGDDGDDRSRGFCNRRGRGIPLVSVAGISFGSLVAGLSTYGRREGGSQHESSVTL